MASDTGSFLLQFQQEMLHQVMVDPDVLLIMGHGLGTTRLTQALMLAHNERDTLTLVINFSTNDVEAFIDEFTIYSSGPRPKVFTADSLPEERQEMYQEGGIIFVTSRILVVDMLMKRIPTHLVKGIIVKNAHTVTPSSTEAFIMRLYRAENRTGFVKAITDNPEGFSAGANSISKVMKALWVTKLLIWPRFQKTVMDELNACAPRLFEYKVPMTGKMLKIRQTLADLLLACLKEIKRLRPSLDIDVRQPETSLLPSFHSSLQRQLEPVWHVLPSKLKQIVNDLKYLQTIASYLDQYDCVSFYHYLETLRQSPNMAFGQNSFLFLLDASDDLFLAAKQRVWRQRPASPPAQGKQQNPQNQQRQDKPSAHSEPELEPSPKWQILSEILKEVEALSVAKTEDGDEDEDLSLKGNSSKQHTKDHALSKSRSSSRGGKTAGVKRKAGDDEDFMAEAAGAGGPAKMDEGEDEDGASEAGHEAGRAPTASSSSPTSSVRALEMRTLICVSDSRTASQVAQFLEHGADYVLQRQLERYIKWLRDSRLLRDSGVLDAGERSGAQGGGAPGKKMIEKRDRVRQFREKRRLKQHAKQDGEDPEEDGAAATSAATLEEDEDEEGAEEGDEGEAEATRNGIGKAKKAGLGEEDCDEGEQAVIDLDKVDDSQAEPNAGGGGGVVMRANPDEDFEDHFCLLGQGTVFIHALNGEGAAAAARLEQALEDVMPSVVIFYDPHLGSTREVEMYAARHKDVHVRVYSVAYDMSFQEQKYLSSVRREKEALQAIIREKEIMAIPADQSGRSGHRQESERLLKRFDSISVETAATASTRKAGGGLHQRLGGGAEGSKNVERPKVIVDMREFRSTLPSIIHEYGMDLEVATLTVGDYILSPDICVERKSLPDLIGSLSSGRLYTQAVAMCQHYAKPVLLIEFDEERSGFNLSSTNSGAADDVDSRDVTSKLTLLTLGFPKLRVFWTKSAYATAELFHDVKQHLAQPDLQRAIAAGVEGGEMAGGEEDGYAAGPQALLRKLPGISSHNVHAVMEKVPDLRTLANLTLDQMTELLGKTNGKLLHGFFNNTTTSK